MTAREIRAKARMSLKGRWGRMTGITLLALLCGVYSFGPFPEFVYTVEELIADASLLTDIRNAFTVNIRTLRAGLLFALGAGVLLGECSCYLCLIKGETPSYRRLFSGLQQIVPAIGMRYFRWLVILGGTLLLILPGICFACQYSLAPWIMAEKECGIREAMTQSRQMMHGSLLRRLRLELSFLPWLLLSLLTLGIGLVFFIPYRRTALAVFYHELSCKR